jgi:hypothetical protein
MIDDFASILAFHCRNTECQVFGQNLFKPSYISGLGKYLVDDTGICSILPNSFDTTNSELTTTGYGIGRALSGSNSVLVVKQQDFLYLALDQLWNTLINIQESDSSRGSFNIVCLVSDLPKEGTQAYSNNISLFQSLSPCLKVFYHYMPLTFELYLAEEHFVGIHFLSVEHIYSDSFFKILPASKVSLYRNSLFLESSSEYETLNIVLGFVPSDYLSSLPEGNIIFPPDVSLGVLKDILSFYVSDFTCLRVNIFDASTPGSSHSASVAFGLSSFFESISFFTYPIRSLGNIKFSLANQSFNV